MTQSCIRCRHLEDVCGCSDWCYCGGIYVCAARPKVSTLRQFPFKKTNCAAYEAAKKENGQ